MSVEMVEFARMAGVPLEPWQEDVLRRIPNEGPIRFDAFRAQRNDQRRAKEMLILYLLATLEAPDDDECLTPLTSLE